MASLSKYLSRHVREDGSRKQTWAVRWRTRSGKSKSKRFDKLKDAENFKARAQLGLVDDDGEINTLAKLADLFLDEKKDLMDAGEMERSTYEGYRQHIHLHLFKDPMAKMAMAGIEPVDVQAFLDRLRQHGVSLPTSRKVQTTVRAVFKLAVSRGIRPGNPAAFARIPGRYAVSRGTPAQVPSKRSCNAILAAAQSRAIKDRGRAEATLRVLMFAGLRPSELRALQVDCVHLDLAPYSIDIRRSADLWGKIREKPKTHHGRRTIFIGQDTRDALRKWILAAPVSDRRLVFPNEAGNVWGNEGITRNVWRPCARMAQVGHMDTERKQWVVGIRLYDLRHVAASIKIAQRCSEKSLKEFMGHHSAQFTSDVYGHLWPADDPMLEAKAANEAERFFDQP